MATRTEEGQGRSQSQGQEKSQGQSQEKSQGQSEEKSQGQSQENSEGQNQGQGKAQSQEKSQGQEPQDQETRGQDKSRGKSQGQEQSQDQSQQEGGEGEDGERTETDLVALNLDPFDVELLGLRVTSEGANLELSAVPDDGKALGNVLHKASDMLSGLTGHEDQSLLDALNEKLQELKELIIDKLRQLIRFILGKIAYMAAERLAPEMGGGGAQGGEKQESQEAA